MHHEMEIRSPRRISSPHEKSMELDSQHVQQPLRSVESSDRGPIETGAGIDLPPWRDVLVTDHVGDWVARLE